MAYSVGHRPRTGYFATFQDANAGTQGLSLTWGVTL